MGLFLNLYLAHLIADFVLQPGDLVVAKREGLKGQLLHASIVAAVAALILVADLPSSLLPVAVVTAAHLAIERLTIRARDTLDARGLFVFVFDQSLHALSLVAITAAFGGMTADSVTRTFGVPVRTTSLAVVCGLATVCFLGSILAFEATRATVPPDETDDGILGWDAARAWGLVERGSAYMLALLLGPGAMVAPFLPRVAMAFASPPRRRVSSLTETLSGLALCVLTYLTFLALEALSQGAITR